MKARGLSPRQIIEEIMTQHWDLKPCPCWVCLEGRAAGCRARGSYLDVNNTHGRVWVDPAIRGFDKIAGSWE